MGRGHWIDKWVMALVIGFTVLHLGSVTASAAQQEEKAVGTLAGPYEALDGLAQFQKDTGQKDVRADNSADTQYKGGPGQCVWFVKAVRTELAGKIFPAGRYGLAWEWYEFFTNTLRWHGGKTPKAGAVMCFGKGTGYPVGHVAVVRAVNGDGTVDVWDSNLLNDGKVRKRKVAANAPLLQGYLYGKDSDVPPISWSATQTPTGTPAANKDWQVCPTNPRLVAKLQKTKYEGQQAFVSSDGGKQFYRITWGWVESNSSQVIWLDWSRDEEWLAVAIAQTEQGNALPRLSDKSISDDQKSIGIYNPEEKVLYWLDGFCGLSGGDVRSVRWASGHIIAYDVIRFSARYYQEVAKQYAVTDKVLARSNADYGSYVGCVAQTLIYEAKSSGPDSDLSRVKSTLEAFAPADGAKILSFVKRNKSAFSRADCRIFREGGLVAGKVWRITITAGPSQAISGEEAGAPDLEMDAVYRLGMSKIALQGLSY